jgi:hypothetical protein
LNPASPDGAVSAPLDSLANARDRRRSRPVSGGAANGAVAQLVERLLCKEEVRSSSLLGSTEGAKCLSGASRMDAGAKRCHYLRSAPAEVGGRAKAIKNRFPICPFRSVHGHVSCPDLNEQMAHLNK